MKCIFMYTNPEPETGFIPLRRVQSSDGDFHYGPVTAFTSNALRSTGTGFRHTRQTG